MSNSSTPAAEPRKTPLYDEHKKLGARLVDFAGWWMPVQYSGIVEEHKACRTAVGVFDVSHMGEVHFRGPKAAEAVQKIVTNHVGKLSDGTAMYTVMCHPEGGIVDDLIVYRVKADHIMIVVNAANSAKDVAWFKQSAGTLCDIKDASDETALISFQGPKAQAALAPLTKTDLGAMKSFTFVTDVDVAGVKCWIARTGYTGEDGFELFCATADAGKLWNALVAAAAKVGGKPVGLGARDTLRLEARLSLYGNDLDDTTTPLEAGLGWVVKLDAADFTGKPALLKQKAEGPKRKLAGFVMLDRGIARHGYAIHGGTMAAPGPVVGQVTSGGPGPTVGKNIGLGYVPAALAEPGTKLVIDCRGKMAEAEVVKGPFYKRAG